MTTVESETLFAPAERVRLELLNRQTAYFQSNNLLAPLLDAVPNVFVILNRQRQIVYANRALIRWVEANGPETLLGLRPGEALDCVHAFEEGNGCGTTEFCRTCGAVQAILTSLSGKETVEECRITRNDGTSLDLRVWAAPFYWSHDIFSLFAVQDVSNEKRREALERIFFHDVLNTASALVGFTDLLADEQGSELRDVDVKGVVFELAQQIVDQIQAQRQLAAAERGDLNPVWVPVDPLDLLESTRRAYVESMIARNREIVIVASKTTPHFTSDRGLLDRVIGNMLKNALEACSPGQRVTLSCYADARRITFSVHNPNVMSREVQLQVFQRSFSTKGAGRGLGTYSMRLLTEQYLHGEIRFITSPDSGTTFYATYPLAPTQDR
ncbi:MAG TPA: PAS domain-containing sensor histidine kinase [Aggregatilinea sp.]|uniref:sensor histidine kinase n=1 Tax=Aggregatilinea sp. TaxID=2806333 RepID=UPI002CC2BB02|nr:PAS domain-containing sensor histidine kinase [Aggregatilinea sp.]HML20501.1 PAS domain-containing sensor histidine kinase [Aggregatilinea sp.]